MSGEDLDDYHLEQSRDWLVKNLRSHDKVSQIVPIGRHALRIERTNGVPIVAAMSGKYVLSAFDLWQLLLTAPSDVNCVVVASSWLKYTSDAKVDALERGIGLFTVGELFGAINRTRDFWKYEKKRR